MSTETDRTEEAKALGVWLHQRTNDVRMRNRDRDRVALAMFQHSLDLVDGSLVLLDNNLPGAALALSRPFLEAYVRGVWALYCANDDEIEGFWTKGRPGTWGLKGLAGLLEKQELEQSKWVRTVVAEGAELNDLVHGGGLHLRGRIGAESIEPRYPTGHVEWLIAQGIEVRIRVGCELFELMRDEQGLRDLNAYVDSHFVRPSVRDGGE